MSVRVTVERDLSCEHGNMRPHTMEGLIRCFPGTMTSIVFEPLYILWCSTHGREFSEDRGCLSPGHKVAPCLVEHGILIKPEDLP